MGIDRSARSLGRNKPQLINGDINILMSESESSSGNKRRDRSRSQDKQKGCKLFITNLDGKADTKEIEEELRRLFEKCGGVDTVVAKRNRNSEYCFAFAEMKDHAAAAECVKMYDQSSLNGKQIKVEFQDDSKRRKDSNKGCYNCGKMGHFARECHSSRNNESSRGYRRRSRSRSRSQDSDRHKKSKRRHRSDSSDRGRSHSPKSKKDRKNRSKDRDEKRKKKHHKRSHSSDS